MKIAKEIIGLLKDIAWPVAILTIAFMFRRSITTLVDVLIPSLDKRQRNLKLKVGSFELESRLDSITQERMKAIAEEPNLKKRLQMAKEPFLVDEALKAIDEKEMEGLQTIYKSRLENAFYLNWYKPEDYGIKREVFVNLEKLNLIKGVPMYDGDEIAYITSTGLALLERISKPKEEKATSP